MPTISATQQGAYESTVASGAPITVTVTEKRAGGQNPVQIINHGTAPIYVAETAVTPGDPNAFIVPPGTWLDWRKNTGTYTLNIACASTSTVSVTRA